MTSRSCARVHRHTGFQEEFSLRVEGRRMLETLGVGPSILWTRGSMKVVERFLGARSSTVESTRITTETPRARRAIARVSSVAQDLSFCCSFRSCSVAVPGAAHDQTGGLTSSSVSPFQNFDFDQNVAKLEVRTDSDWTGDVESRTYCSGGGLPVWHRYSPHIQTSDQRC